MYAQKDLLNALVWHYELESKDHPSFLTCSCCLSTTIRKNMTNNPLEHITKEEFQELFNSTVLIHSKDLNENFETAIKHIGARRAKMLKFIARFTTVVHGMEEATRNYEKNANVIERKKIAEANKRYDHNKKVQQVADQKKTGNDLLDRLIARLGSLEAAEQFLKDLKSS